MVQVAVCYPLVVGPWSTAERAVLMVVAVVGPSDAGHDLIAVGIGHFGDEVHRALLGTPTVYPADPKGATTFLSRNVSAGRLAARLGTGGRETVARSIEEGAPVATVRTIVGNCPAVAINNNINVLDQCYLWPHSVDCSDCPFDDLCFDFGGDSHVLSFVPFPYIPAIVGCQMIFQYSRVVL
jgi:hypothetical protein